jgi:hypothetical protein
MALQVRRFQKKGENSVIHGSPNMCRGLLMRVKGVRYQHPISADSLPQPRLGKYKIFLVHAGQGQSVKQITFGGNCYNRALSGSLVGEYSRKS